MGLDNIPKQYPCKAQGTAVVLPRTFNGGEPMLDDDGNQLTTIDCAATQRAGGCPWLNAYNASDLDGGTVYGIMGTDCWYRGKYGNYLLEAISVYDEVTGVSFYGDKDDSTEKTPASCLAAAAAIDEVLADNPNTPLTMDGEDITKDLRYASWWLKWAAAEADGSVCWY